MMDPDHTEKHTVPKGQSLSEIIDDYYSGSGLDKRFLKLAIVAANPKSFCTAKPKFYVCWSNSAFAKLKPNSSNGIGIPINGKLKDYEKQADNRGIFFFGGKMYLIEKRFLYH